MSTKTTSSSGIGFLGLLALIFIGLKLVGVGVVAEWSWWTVLSPLWIPWAIFIGIGIPAVIVYVICKVWRR